MRRAGASASAAALTGAMARPMPRPDRDQHDGRPASVDSEPAPHAAMTASPADARTRAGAATDARCDPPQQHSHRASAPTGTATQETDQHQGRRGLACRAA